MASSDSEGEGGQESRARMLKRHKKEVLAAQKAAQRLGKKRADEAAALVAEVNARHCAELAELEARPADGGAAPPEAAPAPVAAAATEAAAGAATAALAAASLTDGEGAAAEGGAKKPSKAQLRRAKLAKEEAEREARIRDEKSNMGDSSRVIEENALMAKLMPMQLTVRDIKADGHCLYRSLEDQLALENGGVAPAGRDYQSLRGAAAAYMRRNPDEYAPFVVDGDAEGGEGNDSFERYCQSVEGTAAWGGQLELRALAHVLQRRICVFSAHLPTVEMGEEYAAAGSAPPPLRVAYQQHAYGLGEHYNSVVAAGGPDSD